MISIPVNVAGCEISVGLQETWDTIAPVTTAARWQAGCGELPFDRFEVRDEKGTLLDPYSPLGMWLYGKTLYVSLLAGTGD